MIYLPTTKTKIELSNNDLCLKYSDNAKKLKEILSTLTVSYKFVGIDKYFDSDKEDRPIIRVYLERDKKEVTFKFGMSIVDLEILKNPTKGKGIRKLREGLLYSVLTCVKNEYACPATFEEFCFEFGYDEDSRSAERTFFALMEQSKKLKTVISESEIDCFPN
jgi:hypothetical protein